ncbi:hypothetical protein ScPMuIL_012731 [Solemya velum]
MSDSRKAELEKKKLKLEQMRKERQEKERIRKLGQKETEEVKKKAPQDLRVETEELLKDLGIPPAAQVISPDEDTQKSIPPHKTAPSAAPTSVQIQSKPRGKLSINKVNETSIAPRENVSYSKETQTLSAETSDKEDDEGDTDSAEATVTSPTSKKMPHVELIGPALTAEEIQHQKEEKAVVRELSEEESKQIINTDEFQTFFTKTTRIMERALGENCDILLDYSGRDSEGADDDQLAGERLKLNREFFDEKWSRHRTITSLDWSTQYPELLLSSYNANDDSPHEPDGVAMVWNMKFKKTTPEYIFHCQSAVMSSCFAEFHPNLIVGGTYSGQIVLWDNRVNKRTPVQRTPLSATAHTHPVYCVNVVGTQNAHNLISVSTDGKMCSWSLDMLSQPQDWMELQHKQSKAVAVTCFSFLSNDVNNFVVGSEDCTVYTACRHGSKAGISEAFEGHQGPVTGIDCHKVPGQIDFSPYFLTSSFDWTIKLWSIKDQKFLHSFEDNSDYVYDVQWSPLHPALFTSVDGMGRVDLWNLNNEMEVPSASYTIDNNVSLNRCRWHKSGHSLAVGDDMGRIYIFDVGEHISNPKPDEWSAFVQTLQEMRQHAAEREEDSSMSSSMTSPMR